VGAKRTSEIIFGVIENSTDLSERNLQCTIQQDLLKTKKRRFPIQPIPRLRPDGGRQQLDLITIMERAHANAANGDSCCAV